MNPAYIGDAGQSPNSFNPIPAPGCDCAGCAEARREASRGPETVDAGVRKVRSSGTGLQQRFDIAFKDGGVLYSSETNLTLQDAVFDALVRGLDLRNAELYGAFVLTIVASKHPIYVFSDSVDTFVQVGCQRRTLSSWLKTYETAGQGEGYTPEQIVEYGQHARHIDQLIQLRKATAEGRAQAEAEARKESQAQRVTAQVNSIPDEGRLSVSHAIQAALRNSIYGRGGIGGGLEFPFAPFFDPIR